jgi:hypothetical protein
VNFEFTPNWAITIMPGFKHEFARSSGTPIGTFLYEFFAGPAFNYKSEIFLLKIPLWYYYLGFPNNSDGSFSGNQNVAFIPEIIFFCKNWSFGFRLFFHNTFYSDSKIYTTESQRAGYSLLITEKIEIGYKVNDWIKLILADELFTGAIPDTEAAPTSGSGFYRQGLTKNKFYAGVVWTFSSRTRFSTQYVLEANFDQNMRTSQIDHQIYLIISHSIRLYGADAKTSSKSSQ